PLAARLARSRGIHMLFLIATAAGVLRFLWICLDILGYSPWPVLLSQPLHGIQFAGYYMGAIFTLRALFPDHLFGTANGIYMLTAAAGGGMVGNVFYGRWLNQLGSASDPNSFLPLFFSAMLI